MRYACFFALLLCFPQPGLYAQETTSAQPRGGGERGKWGEPGKDLDESRTRAQNMADRLVEHRGDKLGLSEKQFDDLWAKVGTLDEAQQKQFYDDYLAMTSSYFRSNRAEMRGDTQKARELDEAGDAALGRLKGYGEPGEMLAKMHLDGLKTAWGPGSSSNKPTPGHADSAAQIGRDFPRNDGIQTGVGDILRDSGRPQEAQNHYQQALLTNPRNIQALNGLAQTQVQLGDYSGAVETGMNALSINPSDPVANSIVRMYKGRENASNSGLSGGAASQAAAPAQFRQFSDPVDIRQNTGRPTVGDARAAAAGLAAQAERYIAVRDAARAEEAAAKAMESDPQNKKALRALMRSLFMQHKFAQALSVADRGLALYPDDPLLSVMKANSLTLMGRYQDALSAAEFGLAQNPGNADLLLSKGFALNRLGRYEEARAVLREAEKDPNAARFARAALAQNDEDMGAFFTAALLGESMETAKKPAPEQGSRGLRWAAIAAGIAAGLGLIFFGFMRSGDWAESMRRSLGRMSSASPAVQPMATPPAVDGLTASSIRLDKKIGQGGMGVVYLGTDMSLDRPVAIKKMREEIRSDPRERERFLREAKTVAALRHPHIVEIYSIIEDGSDVYLVFEYVTGKTVHDLTYERGTLPFAYAVGVVRAVASALDYAHRRGVIHRDLKPSNIMVEDEGMVKVMDFGVARTAKDSLSRMSMTNTVVGTPPYMAPEQEQGIVRKESDVYALAICLYEMVAGQLPFQGVGAGMLMAKLNGTFVPPSKLVQGLPEGFDRVMAAALHPDPEKRLQTAGDLVKALDSLPVA